MYESQVTILIRRAQWGLATGRFRCELHGSESAQCDSYNGRRSCVPVPEFCQCNSVAGQGTSGIKAYRATPTAAANETTTPLLMAGSYTVAVTHTTADGQEILALTMDNTPTLRAFHCAFGYGVINWVTKGIFLGSRKVYLNPEIDDFLLGNWIYAPSLHPGVRSWQYLPNLLRDRTRFAGNG